MKIVFLSNYYNHHQAPFSEEMYKLIGDSYIFIETRLIEAERKAMGWAISQYPSFVKKSYESKEEMNKCIQDVINADVVIIGSAPERFIKERIQKGKLVFRYSERPLKNGIEPLKYPLRWIRWHLRNPKKKPIYMLCASAYTSIDYAKFGLFKGRCYKWGYFPKLKNYENIENVLYSKRSNTILWVSRLIKLKHPEVPLIIAKRLKIEGYNFSLTLIGIGPMEDMVREYIINNNLNDCVKLLGSMSPEEVRLQMEQSEVFLFTSDKREGWGAVLNESMNSACAVIANSAIGSVPFLIRDGENGLIYKDGNIDELYEKVTFLLNNHKELKEMGRNAYYSIAESWNEVVATKRLLQLFGEIEKFNSSTIFSEGPCSKAENNY